LRSIELMKRAIMQTQIQEAKAKISPTGREILNFLRSRGGVSSVGIIASNRSTTIKHLRRLQKLGLIECLDQPEKFKPHSDAVGIEGRSLTCGIWRIISVQFEEKTRTCDFCGFTGLYGEFPDGSICFEKTVACGTCLKKESTKEFRSRIEGHLKKTERGIEWSDIR